MMTNGEKFRNEILAIFEKNRRFAIREDNPTEIIKCTELNMCSGCLFNDGMCDVNKTKWLISEYREPIEIDKLEYGILNHILIHTDYKYIVRDYMGKIFVFTHEPTKDLKGGYWGVGEGRYENASFLKDLFRFVKWTDDKPTSIKGILENCDVKGNMNGE